MDHRVYLIRHGQAAAGWAENPDPPLSDAGREQARAVAAQFTGMSPLPIFSSPLRRARETAQPLADAWEEPVRIESAFAEIPAPAELSLQQRLGWLLGIREQSWSDADDALWRWRDGILARLAAFDSACLIFTHFMVMNLVAGVASGDDRLVHYQPDNGSVLSLTVMGSRIRVHELGRQAATRVL